MSLDYLYIGLLKNNELGFVEVSQDETNYRRIETGPGDWFFLDVDKKDTITNAVEVEFPDATCFWGKITHFGIFDSLNNGGILKVGTLNKPNIIYEECKIKFEVGCIQIPLEMFETLGV